MSQFYVSSSGGGSSSLNFVTDSGVATPAANTINLVGGLYSDTIAAANNIQIIAKTEAVYIVDSVAAEGTHTTIASAMAAAVSGDTIFIRPGSYTENVTLKGGVSIVGWTGDKDIPTVTINGTLSYSAAATVLMNISNIRLQTNGAPVISFSGTSSSTIFINNCSINASGTFTAISMTSSGSTSSIRLANCTGNISSAAANYFASTSVGSIICTYCAFRNAGNSPVANTFSAGSFAASYSQFTNPFSTSSTAVLVAVLCDFNCLASNSTALTLDGTSATITGGTVSGGTASAISAAGSITVTDCAINSTNTNAITGVGTISYSGLYFSGASYTINTTTQSLRVTNGGEYKGRSLSTVPSVGMVGEQIRATLAKGSAVSLPTGTVTNITSIALTAGIWDVSAVTQYSGMITGSSTAMSIVTTSATIGTQGDNYITSPMISTAVDAVLTIPSYRLSLSTTTTVYLTASSVYTVGAVTGYGRISATRVA